MKKGILDGLKMRWRLASFLATGEVETPEEKKVDRPKTLVNADLLDLSGLPPESLNAIDKDVSRSLRAAQKMEAKGRLVKKQYDRDLMKLRESVSNTLRKRCVFAYANAAALLGLCVLSFKTDPQIPFLLLPEAQALLNSLEVKVQEQDAAAERLGNTMFSLVVTNTDRQEREVRALDRLRERIVHKITAAKALKGAGLN